MLRREFVVGPSVLIACSAEPPASQHVQTSDPAPPTVPNTLTANVPEPPPVPTPHAGAGPDEQAMRAASTCITSGQLALQHCLGLLGVGDVGLADCARAVSDMVAVSQATQALAAAGSPALKAQAGVAVTVLTRCEECCRKHAAHHDACRDCANHCEAALKVYRRLAA